MHQIRFRLGFRPMPRCESVQRSSGPLAGFKGPTSKGKEGRERRRLPNTANRVCMGTPLSPLLLCPEMESEYCDERVCLSVCVCVCLSTIISSELHVRFSPKFLCLLPMVVPRSSSGGVLIGYALPVLWMTSYLLISQGGSTSPPS